MNALLQRTASVPVNLMILPHGENLPHPTYATSGAAGMDIFAAVEDQAVIFPRQKRLIPTGISVALPNNYELQIRPRSGLALKHGVTVANSPGTIDEDYRGEVGVILINQGEQPFTVRRGDRIAQAVLAPVVRCAWNVVSSLDETERGAGGFGSTGTHG